jgi:hypothetical protein
MEAGVSVDDATGRNPVDPTPPLLERRAITETRMTGM